MCARAPLGTSAGRWHPTSAACHPALASPAPLWALLPAPPPLARAPLSRAPGLCHGGRGGTPCTRGLSLGSQRRQPRASDDRTRPGRRASGEVLAHPRTRLFLEGRAASGRRGTDPVAAARARCAAADSLVDGPTWARRRRRISRRRDRRWRRGARLWTASRDGQGVRPVLATLPPGVGTLLSIGTCRLVCAPALAAAGAAEGADPIMASWAADAATANGSCGSFPPVTAAAGAPSAVGAPSPSASAAASSVATTRLSPSLWASSAAVATAAPGGWHASPRRGDGGTCTSRGGWPGGGSRASPGGRGTASAVADQRWRIEMYVCGHGLCRWFYSVVGVVCFLVVGVLPGGGDGRRAALVAAWTGATDDERAALGSPRRGRPFLDGPTARRRLWIRG